MTKRAKIDPEVHPFTLTATVRGHRVVEGFQTADYAIDTLRRMRADSGRVKHTETGEVLARLRPDGDVVEA